MGELTRIVYDRATGRVLATHIAAGFVAGPTEILAEVPTWEVEVPPDNRLAFHELGHITWRETPRPKVLVRLGLGPADLRALAEALRPFLARDVGPR